MLQTNCQQNNTKTELELAQEKIIQMKNIMTCLLMCVSLISWVGCAVSKDVSGMYRSENGDWVDLDSRGQMRISSDCMNIPSSVAYEVMDKKVAAITNGERHETHEYFTNY